jgi:hypothetical protein
MVESVNIPQRSDSRKLAAEFVGVFFAGGKQDGNDPKGNALE